MAYAAAFNAGRAAQRPMCTHCGKAGHTIQKCFKLHGYPPGYRAYGSYHNKNVSQSKNVQSQLKYQNQSLVPASSQVSNAVSNVCADQDSRQYSLPPVTPRLTSGGMDLHLQSFTPDTEFDLSVQCSCSSFRASSSFLNVFNSTSYDYRTWSNGFSFIVRNFLGA
ncbi:PREDICTED: uncharacterized protein LOC106320224 [Brassica oleracea var. oleracea]|uniref:uncharacterized protein LOC106320224 n=1 Tax=Brassica oleracea var. oleracea TaxID=109376 RepID=UPI0006A73700|nr:PREDICTED: uncharacterized protein LOC106320224 [Brassica oleracea var. oleracea]